MLGLVQNKDKETCKVSLTKETKQTFWMEELELKSVHPSNPVCIRNLAFLVCFEDGENRRS